MARARSKPKVKAKTKKAGRGKRFATGVDIGSYSVKIVTLAGDDAGTLEIGKITIVPLKAPESTEYPEEKLNRQRDALKEAVKKHGKMRGRIVLGFPRELATVRYLNLPSSNREELKEMLLYDVERHVPFSVDDIEISFQVIEQLGDHESRLMMVCVPQKEIDPYVEMCTQIGLDIDAIDLDILGVSAVYQRSLKPEETAAVLDFGRSSVKMGIVRDGKLLFSRSMPITERSLLQGFAGAKGWRDLQGRVTAMGALHPAEREHFAQWVDRLGVELFRSISAFVNENGGVKLERMILCGGASYFPAGPPRGLSLKVKTNAAVEIPLNGDLPANDQYRGSELAASLGLAIRGLEPSGKGLNLLPEEFVQERIQKQKSNFRKNAAIIAFMIFTLLGATGYLKWHEKFTDYRTVQDYYNSLSKDTAKLNQMRTKIKTVEEYLDKDQSCVIVIQDILNLLKDKRVYLNNITFSKRKSLEINGQVLSENDLQAFLIPMEKKPYITKINHTTTRKVLDLGAMKNFEVMDFSMSCTLNWDKKGSAKP